VCVGGGGGGVGGHCEKDGSYRGGKLLVNPENKL
jgi:hypothetical protein